jgi:hypothetical protein
VARSAWRRPRKPTLTNGREADRTGFTDEPTHDGTAGDGTADDGTAGDRRAEDGTAEDSARQEKPSQPSEGRDPHTTPRAAGDAALGCAVLAGLIVVASILFIMYQVADGDLTVGQLFVVFVLGVVITVAFTAVTWWAANALRERKNDPSEECPRAGRTEDDQNSVGSP